jgi:hypothetical protein
VGPILGKVALADALELQGLLPARAAFLDGVGGQPQQDLTVEGVVLRVERRQACGDLAEVQTAGDPRQRYPGRRNTVVGRGSLLLHHQPRPYLGLGDVPASEIAPSGQCALVGDPFVRPFEATETEKRVVNRIALVWGLLWLPALALTNATGSWWPALASLALGRVDDVCPNRPLPGAEKHLAADRRAGLGLGNH